MLKQFPFYEQHDTMDCGPTCLRMIARHYGRSYAVQELRRKSFITREGVSMLGISDAAEAIGFRTLGVKITFEKLRDEAPLPCIVHWRQEHFAVVYKIRKDEVHVADPAVGLIVYTVKEFLQSWVSVKDEGHPVGITMLLEPTPEFYARDPETDNNLKISSTYFFGYLKTHRRLIFQLFLGLILGSAIQLLLPFLTQSIVDVGIRIRSVNFIYLVLAGQLMLFFGRTAVEFLRRWILLHLSTRINISIISDFLIKLMKLPLSFFDQKMMGDLLRRIEDHTRIEHFLSASTLNILFSGFNLIVFGLVLLFYNIPIFIVFFVASALYVGYILVFMKKRRDLDYKRFNQMARNQSGLIQMIQGMAEIKLNNCEKQKRWEWERVQASLFHVNVKSMRLQQYQDSGSMFINELKNMFITVMAAQAVIEGSMTLGMMMSVQYIIGQMNAPVNDFVTFSRELQDARISLERIGEVHNMKEESFSTAALHGHPVLQSQGQTMRLEGLSFSYEGPNSPQVLDGLDLTVPYGKVTAIVGSSGSGKTTLMKLLLKFYSPTGGKILLGRTDLDHMQTDAWRQRCGTVMQDGFIFADTIARNIALSGDDIDNEKLVHAATVANIHEFIDELPLGYQTKIGAEGTGLSQGQKQRLLIARAVYKNPEFLFFDEATSSLDANNEKRIVENLDAFFKNKTVLVIAHRLSTVKNADQIVVLEKGKVVESGNHEELTAKRGAYFELVKNQLELGS
jgi:ATP-binding cassette subfamily B protein